MTKLYLTIVTLSLLCSCARPIEKPKPVCPGIKTFFITCWCWEDDTTHYIIDLKAADCTNIIPEGLK